MSEKPTQEQEVPVGEDAQEWRPSPSLGPDADPAGGVEQDRGHPVGQWVAGGGSGLGIAGAALYQTTGVVGLAAGAVVAAGGAATYVAYRLRGGRRGSSFGKVTGTRGSTRSSSTRTLGGGRGGKLGKGPKLGGRGGRAGLGGGKGPKLGKGGSKLGQGRKGPALSGKSAGLGSVGKGRSGRGAAARMGSVGAGRGRGLLGRGGKAGLGLGKRGGKALGGLGGRGRAGLGRWSKSTGAGAGVAGSRLGRAAVKARRAAAAKALGTRAGQRLAKAAVAGKTAAAKGGKGRLARWNSARRAARAALTSSQNPFARWAASTGAGLLAALTLLQARWRAKHPKPGRQQEEQQERPAQEGEAARSCPPSQPPPTPDFQSTTTSPTATTRRTHPMDQFPLASAAAEVEAAAATYWPESMWHVDQDLEQLHELPLHLAEGLKRYTQALQAAYPINPVVVEALGRMYVALGEVATASQEVPKLFKQAHEDDIRRKTQPRIGEDKWNV